MRMTTLLSLACIATTAAIVGAHQYRDQDRPSDAVEIHTAGSDATWFGNDATLDRRGTAAFTADPQDGSPLATGALTPSERAQAARRWRQLRDLAHRAPARTPLASTSTGRPSTPSTAPRNPGRPQRVYSGLNPSTNRTYTGKRRRETKRERRATTMFERSRRYRDSEYLRRRNGQGSATLPPNPRHQGRPARGF